MAAGQKISNIGRRDIQESYLPVIDYVLVRMDIPLNMRVKNITIPDLALEH
jgi:hypothetical protein